MADLKYEPVRHKHDEFLAKAKQRKGFAAANDSLEPEKGWTSIRHGASWIYVVEFTDAGPKSQGFLTYSQSTDPTSPHHSDQTELYSKKGWDDLLWRDEDVEKATVTRVTIKE